MVRLPNFYIDERLVAAHKQQLPQWLNAQFLNNERSRTRFISKFASLVEFWCRDLTDIRAMLEALETLHFNPRMIGLLRQMPES